MQVEDSNEYNAKSIKILSDAVAAKRFGYEKAIELSNQYAGVSAEWLKLIVEASNLCGIEPEIVCAKYLDLDKTVTLPEEFAEIYKDLLREKWK